MKIQKGLFFAAVILLMIFALAGCNSKKHHDDDNDVIDSDPISNDENDFSADSDTDEEHKSDEDKDIPEEPAENDTDSSNETINDEDSDSGIIDEDPADNEQQPDENRDEEPEQDADLETDDEEEIIVEEKENAGVVCTGQNNCYSEDDILEECPEQSSILFGQDWQYTSLNYCKSRSFSTQGSDIVKDNNTELMWQRTLPEKFDGCQIGGGDACRLSEAISYCENLTLGGYNDWRLPTPKELSMLIDYGSSTGMSNLFSMREQDGTPTNQQKFWANSANSEEGLFVDFQTKLISEKSSETVIYARCVRGNQLAEPDFTITNPGDSEEIVKDSLHNLYWTKNTKTQLSWPEALNYCKRLEYGGQKGWHLPSINELVTMINYSKRKPASDFPEIPSSQSLWSSTTSLQTNSAFSMKIINGATLWSIKEFTATTICVK